MKKQFYREKRRGWHEVYIPRATQTSTARGLGRSLLPHLEESIELPRDDAVVRALVVAVARRSAHREAILPLHERAVVADPEEVALLRRLPHHPDAVDLGRTTPASRHPPRDLVPTEDVLDEIIVRRQAHEHLLGELPERLERVDVAGDLPGRHRRLHVAFPIGRELGREDPLVHTLPCDRPAELERLLDVVDRTHHGVGRDVLHDVVPPVVDREPERHERVDILPEAARREVDRDRHPPEPLVHARSVHGRQTVPRGDHPDRRRPHVHVGSVPQVDDVTNALRRLGRLLADDGEVSDRAMLHHLLHRRSEHRVRQGPRTRPDRVRENTRLPAGLRVPAGVVHEHVHVHLLERLQEPILDLWREPQSLCYDCHDCLLFHFSAVCRMF